MYHVYGWCRKTNDEVLLHSADTSSEAVRWAKGYTKQGDMGGWDKINVVEFTQVDVDQFADVVIWSCWQEPMEEWSDNAMDYRKMEEF